MGSPKQKMVSGAISQEHSVTDHEMEYRPSSLQQRVLGRSISVLVAISYLVMSVSQSYAMEKTQDDGDIPLKLSGTAIRADQVFPIDSLENETRSDLSTPEKDKVSEEQKVEIEPAHSDVDRRSAELEAFDTLVHDTFKRREEVGFALNARRMATLACTSVKNTVVDSPAMLGNAGIWTAARVKKTLYGTDMPTDNTYFSYVTSYYADQDYYGNEKNSYAQALAALMIAVPLGVFALKGEIKAFGYKVFSALAKDPYFYEEFYYKHPDNPYYIRDKFMTAMTVYTAIMLPWFLLYQTSEFVKGLSPSREEKILTEHQGKYIEGLMGSYIVLSALSAGFFFGADYFVTAYAYKGTPNMSNEDLGVLPVMLGVSFALTMYNINKKSINKEVRDWSRWWYGDDAMVERDTMIGLVDTYQKKIKNMPTASAVKSTQVAVDDVESQTPIQTVDALNAELHEKSGLEITSVLMDGKLVKKRRTAGLNIADLASLQAQHQESSFMKGLNQTRQFVLKNWSLIVGAIFSAPVGYLSYESFLNSTQLVVANNFEALTVLENQQQARISYEIIKKYKEYNQAHPYEWLEQCLDPKNIRIQSNETYFVDDDGYYGTDFYNTTTYRLTFTSQKCKGIDPTDPWYAFPQDMLINDNNAIGESSWFSVWENGYAYIGGVPIAANNYEVADVPTITVSTQSKIFANVGAGFYATGIYAVSTFATSAILNQLGNMEWTTMNTALFPVAFLQGVVKSSPLVVATYLSVYDMENAFLKWGIVAMTATAASLSFVEDFIKVMKKMGGKLFGLCADANVREDVIDKTNVVKDIIHSMTPSAVKELYKKVSELS